MVCLIAEVKTRIAHFLSENNNFVNEDYSLSMEGVCFLSYMSCYFVVFSIL